MSADYLAFFMGLLGSLHCVAMCGPLVLALPEAGAKPWQRIGNRLLYQLGRILTYGAIGLFIGTLGVGLFMQGWQQALSITTGLLLLAMAGFELLGGAGARTRGIQQRLLTPLVRYMSYWMSRPGGNFMTGVLNGILPCGMVYMALATALNTGSGVQGARFMLLFGLGTLPLMLTTALLGNVIRRAIPFRLSRWLPFLFLVMGIWFILRGSALDIPFLSPVLNPAGMLICQ